jgi:hypothetical protein
MEWLKIIVLSVVCAVLYGILHNQITARLWVEYFTIGHPPVFGTTQDPTTLAFGWGVLATWWVGLLLGVPLATIARAGSRPKLSARDVLKPIFVLLAFIGVVALIMGIVGFFAARVGAVWLLPDLAARIPSEKHTLYLTDLWAHSAAYVSAFVGGIACCGWVWWKRRKRHRLAESGSCN